LKPQRGLTFVAVLFYLAIAAGIWWVATFGPAYWENLEVKSTLHEAANLCYHERNDAAVRKFIVGKLHTLFDVPGPPGQATMSIDFDPGDLRLERTETPKHVNIWLTYSRTVKTPFVNQERSVTFTDFAEQDLNDVKW
jgi:hypothetical protein